jgi:rhodanese-related sulfurtransferase
VTRLDGFVRQIALKWVVHDADSRWARRPHRLAGKPIPSPSAGANMTFDNKRFLLAVALCAALGTSPAWADKPPTPTTLAGGKLISASEAKQLVAGKSAQFFDTRSPVNFGKGHVPGASTAAYKEKSEPVANFDAGKDDFDLSKLPADKAAPIVFYSDGPTGWKSYKAAVLAVKAGHRNVMYMRGGFAEWESAGNAVQR